MRTPGSAVGGFTLIELLVTVTVLAVGIVVVLESFQSSLFALGASRGELRAGALARLVLEEAELDLRDDGQLALDWSGGVQALFPDYRWDLATRERERVGPGTNQTLTVYDVTVEVRQPTTGRAQRLVSRLAVEARP